MKSVAMLTVMDVFKISFLVQRGWEYHEYSEKWSKTGEKWKLDPYQEGENRRFDGRLYDVEMFTLDAAFCHQQQKEENNA